MLRLKHGRAQHLVEGGLCRRETLVCTQIMIPRGDTNGGCSTEVTVTSRKLECRGMVLVLGARNSDGILKMEEGKVGFTENTAMRHRRVVSKCIMS